MKFLIRLGIALLAILVILLVTLPLYVDSVAAAAVERGGSRALGVPTHVGSTDVALFAGGFSLEELQVANPEGYSEQPFLALDSGSAQVALGTLLEDPIRIPSVKLRGARLNLERRGLDSNYGEILGRLEDETDAPPGDATGYVVDELLIEDVSVRADLLGIDADATTAEVNIDRIRLQNIGSDNARGVVMDELARILVQALLEAVVEHGVTGLPEAVIEDLGKGLGGLSSLGEQGIQLSAQIGSAVGGALQKAGEELGGAAERAAKEALEGLGGVLGGDDADRERKDDGKQEDGGRKDSD